MKYFVVKFLTRSGCHLCDEARPLVKREVIRRGGSLVEVDIDTDDVLTRDFGLRVPVLLGPGDVVLAEGVIEAGSLRRALRRMRRA
ncbi:MAG TPA: glutaredoxin family protein [Acidimicrobiia bacterium]|nr:glutaredoxin family protein [Acidimicrobiia bacterium]